MRNLAQAVGTFEDKDGGLSFQKEPDGLPETESNRTVRRSLPIGHQEGHESQRGLMVSLRNLKETKRPPTEAKHTSCTHI